MIPKCIKSNKSALKVVPKKVFHIQQKPHNWGFCCLQGGYVVLKEVLKLLFGEHGINDLKHYGAVFLVQLVNHIDLLEIGLVLNGHIHGLNMAYTYDAAGQKLRKVSNQGGTTDYIGGIQYATVNSSYVIDFVPTEEGRARRRTDGTYYYIYDLNDHLGNVRLTFQKGADGAAERIQSDDYYAFGMRKSVAPASVINKYLYNKKELQEELNQYDYGARFYDPVIARWMSVDLLVEMGQESTSPYGYVLGNPIRLTDPDGRAPEDGPGPKWLRTALFSISHPIAASAIGSANNSLNISSAAVRFSTRGESASSKGSILSEPAGWGNEGSEVNAFRHTIWQGTIASQFGEETARGVGFAHEDNPNTNWGKDYTQMSFKSLTEADGRIDLMNNMIGRDIGNENKGMGMKEIALKTLDVFKKDGLFTANKQEDGTFKISRTTISNKQYSALKKTINSLDANGFRSEERKKREEQDQNHVIK